MHEYIVSYRTLDSKHKLIILARDQETAKKTFTRNYPHYDLESIQQKEDYISALNSSQRASEEMRQRMSSKSYLTVREYAIIEQISKKQAYRRISKAPYKKYIKKNSSPTRLHIEILNV